MPLPIRLLTLGLVLGLGACNSTPLSDAAGEGGLAAITGEGECGPGAWQGYVGQRVDALNTVDLPADARVLFPTTPATMDFRAERLNIEVDASDTITRVYCG